MTAEERDEMLSHGAAAERERIIALLEEQAHIHKADAHYCTGKQAKWSKAFSEAYFDAIALIKGDDK